MSSPGKARLFLLTGPSGSGKSTLGKLLVSHLNSFGIRPAFLLDGDAARLFFNRDLLYTPDDRDAMTKRMAFAAFTLTENNIDVVMANIAGKKETRQFIKKKVSDYIEVYHDVDISVLIKNDAKGVYTSPQVVGIDIPYDRPDNPDVIVYPYTETPEDSLNRIVKYLAGRGAVMGTKADTLSSLSKFLKQSTILPQVILTWTDISDNPEQCIQRVRTGLGTAAPYIIRSSCRNEDGKLISNAGVFTSVCNVPSTVPEFMVAAETVYHSYLQNGIVNPEDEQFLIQPMLSGVRMSGVICTRYKSADSPYYVINYDDVTGKTDTITSGTGGKVVYISRFIRREDLGIWELLITAIKELESLYPKFPLDIEFAVLDTGEIVILQCRPLLVTVPHILLEESAGELLQELKLRFTRCQLPQPHIPGKETILSDMTDWNPSEIIGDRPSTLSYSLYRELVTDSTWHEARSSQGYYDLIQANLMLSMARKPYIDTRLSFASLTPAGLRTATREKLVTGYIDTLKKHQCLHDKVEFEVLYTCYDFTTEQRIHRDSTLTPDEISEVLGCLKQLTNELVLGIDAARTSDFECLDKLDEHLKRVNAAYSGKAEYWDYFNAAFLLIEHTRKLGVYPFARLARLAFIGRAILYSISPAFASEFLAGVTTIASQFSDDVELYQNGGLSKETFFERYGHLRMNTYDICSPRYDQLPDTVWSSSSGRRKKEGTEKPVIYCGEEDSELDTILKEHGLTFTSGQLFYFIKTAIQAREEAKYRFTRALSDLLEYLGKGGEILGLTRQELQYITVPVLLRFRNPEFGSPARASQYLKHRIQEKVHEREVFDLIKLPSVITCPKDIELVEFQASKPNFITDMCIVAPAICLDTTGNPVSGDLTGKIVVIENADPGYDWIFTHRLAGLITKYGGVASHMAIRCNEFSVPGAIGCGELIYSGILGADMIRLDCKSEVITTV